MGPLTSSCLSPLRPGGTVWNPHLSRVGGQLSGEHRQPGGSLHQGRNRKAEPENEKKNKTFMVPHVTSNSFSFKLHSASSAHLTSNVVKTFGAGFEKKRKENCFDSEIRALK